MGNLIISEEQVEEVQGYLQKLEQILSNLKQETKDTYYPKPDSKYCVFVDAGHGAINPQTNKYECIVGGKQFTHKGTRQFHSQTDTYFEGVGNRILAEKLIQKLKENGISYLKTYHEYLDYGLVQRASIANVHHRTKQKGFGESIHSNASRNHNASGWSVWTSPRQTESDRLADELYLRTRDSIEEPYKVKMRSDKWSDGDWDWEAKFTILTRTIMPFILSENMFFDYLKDALLLMDSTFQDRLIQPKLEAVLWGQENLVI